MFDTSNGRLLANFGLGGFANTLSFTGDGTGLLTSTDTDLLLWDVTGAATAAGTAIELPGNRSGWINPEYAVDGPNLAVHSLAWNADSDEATGVVLVLVDPDTGSTIDHIAGFGVQLADGRFVVAQYELGKEDPQNGPLVVWDPASGSITEIDSCVALLSELDARSDIDCPGPFFSYIREVSLVASVDGSYFAVQSSAPSGSRPTVRVWDAATLDVRSEFQIPNTQWPTSAGTNWLAAFDEAKQSVVVYDVDSGEVIAEPEKASEFGWRMTATPDGGILFVEDAAGKPSVWAFDTSTWETIAAWVTHDASHRGLAVSPDGSKLVTTGEDNLVKVWDITNLDKRTSVNGRHRFSIASRFPASSHLTRPGSQTTV